MTDIEQKALALLNEVQRERGLPSFERYDRTFYTEEALCRAIEQHEAFRQEVSDAVVSAFSGNAIAIGKAYWLRHFDRFIIAKPDPLVEVFDECFHQEVREGETWSEAMARKFRAVIEKFDGKIVWGEG